MLENCVPKSLGSLPTCPHAGGSGTEPGARSEEKETGADGRDCLGGAGGQGRPLRRQRSVETKVTRKMQTPK